LVPNLTRSPALCRANPHAPDHPRACSMHPDHEVQAGEHAVTTGGRTCPRRLSAAAAAVRCGPPGRTVRPASSRAHLRTLAPPDHLVGTSAACSSPQAVPKRAAPQAPSKQRRSSAAVGVCGRLVRAARPRMLRASAHTRPLAAICCRRCHHSAIQHSCLFPRLPTITPLQTVQPAATPWLHKAA